MELHFTDVNGNHFVVPDAPDGYVRDDGAAPIAAPPTPSHRWVDGAWVVPRKSSDKDILSAPALGFGGPTAKELFNGNR